MTDLKVPAASSPCGHLHVVSIKLFKVIFKMSCYLNIIKYLKERNKKLITRVHTYTVNL